MTDNQPPPTEDVLDPQAATGPIVSGDGMQSLRDTVRHLGEKLSQHIETHSPQDAAEVKQAAKEIADSPTPQAANAPIHIIGQACAIGPFADGSWLALYSHAEKNDAMVWRIPPRQVKA